MYHTYKVPRLYLLHREVMADAGQTINPLATELNPICKSQLAELFCGGI